MRLLKNLSNKKVFSRLRLGLIVVGVLSSAHALSSSSYLDPARIDYTRPDATKQLELIDCFKNGNCVQDDKIRIYPMPCNGSGSEDCTGCYVMRGGTPFRIGDLNHTTGTCSGVGSDSDQKIRVFVGYERKCPSGTAVGAPCIGTGQIILSCSMTSEGTAGVADSGFVYNKECFSGTPYIRRAKLVAATVTALPSSTLPTGQTGCDAGTTGIYPSCLSCTDTSYKPTVGNAACTECVSPDIANSDTRTYTTAGTTKTSVNDCRVLDYTCMTGYTKNTVSQTCDVPPPPAPIFSPTPSPTPTPSLSPSQWTCADANVRMTAGAFKSTAPSYDYVSSAHFSWNKGDASGGIESVLVIFTQVASPYYQKMYPYNFSGTSATGLIMGGPSTPGNTPGEYQVRGRYTVNGVVCPELGPVSFILPSTPGFTGGT